MTKMLYIAMAVFLVLSVTSVVFAEDETGNYWGVVTAVDNDAKTLSVATPQPAVSPLEFNSTYLTRKEDSGYIMATEETTKLTGCSMQKDLHDLKIGDLVSIRYKEIDGKYIAEVINIKNC